MMPFSLMPVTGEGQVESPKHGVWLGFTNQVSTQSILEYLPEAWRKPVRDVICKFPEKRNYLRPQEQVGMEKEQAWMKW